MTATHRGRRWGGSAAAAASPSPLAQSDARGEEEGGQYTPWTRVWHCNEGEGAERRVEGKNTTGCTPDGTKPRPGQVARQYLERRRQAVGVLQLGASPLPQALLKTKQAMT